MKKKIAFLLAVLLTLCLSTVAFANAAEVSKEDQMAVMVKNFLDKNEYPYGDGRAGKLVIIEVMVEKVEHGLGLGYDFRYAQHCCGPPLL